MVDKRMSLTFSVRNNPGRYALLLGSGVSTGAGVPTGWVVVEDLIRKLAAAREEDLQHDPFDWYKEEYGEEAAYDDLIGELAGSQEERRSLLEDYFEPSEEERGRDEKTPTKAHESIAWLIDNGYIDVVLTTNFDQLLEDALAEYGVKPVVITGPESARGAEPLAHQDAVVIKVNGDYKETDIKNLATELEEYSEPMQELIDRVFKDYGLIVCGWSGKWDTRLRESLKSCKVHRYSTYWSHHGELEEEAEPLVSHRDAITIQNEGAARFFSELKESVEALEGAESAAPLSREVARERVKKYLTREQHKIDLADLIKEEAEEVSAEIFEEERFPLHNDSGEITVEDRLEEYGSVVGTLAVATMTCSYWGNQTVNIGLKPTVQAIQHIGSTPSPENKYTPALKLLRRYPATLVMYGVGMAALASENWNVIQKLLSQTTVEVHRSSLSYSDRSGKEAQFALHPWRISDKLGSGFERERQEKSIRSQIKDQLREPAMDFLSSSTAYEQSFEDFEAIADLALIERVESRDGEMRLMGTTYWGETVSHLRESLDEQGEDWGPLQVGMFEASPDRSRDLLDTLENLSTA
ncbi:MULTISPECIES: SIR2 family protein [Halobacterium]|uniref:SIR2-like domain-containing protein n=1 Tax=Halobacterium salinarum (strain ATCC 33171 / DSM 3754 / JCM 8978 / NBRC 102687 / NCIMB 764 / 91-R6) TaxID=2597657 RepID=A0A4D6GWH1_HALS9|nr:MULTISPECIES: SIR2 family protein [Halobacterium]MCF2207761.1 SIR2 family protein [Halobacterium salinarum]MCF2237977.1 SIR2 family protein [Halobacterium salinarum]MDL0123401.1 SIR2 family protein [Halobacterium salinarum]MDL0134168.1 SIR2 family protein [Halobacterium salinarum]MDL0139207.1 SIR2 family protein [Halobacterium salinarum]